MLASVGIVSILIVIIFIIMENKTSAKDFFLHLGSMVALYTVTISFLNLVFKIINKSFPEVASNIYAWGGGSEISMPVATIIIFFPLFVILSRFVYKIYTENPAKKDLGIRKWLTYITLFVAGIILAGDLVTVLYKFLDGQDLTAAFFLKALSVLLVTGCVFGFYLQDIRDRVSSKGRRVWAIVIGVIVLVSIILGFGILGSPKTQRLIRLDNQKISDLQSLQWQVINYWQVNGMIPESMPGAPEGVEYKKTGNLDFELCVTFNKENMGVQSAGVPQPSYPVKSVTQNDNWEHKAGLQCFSRTIDPVAYPTQVRG